MRTYDDLLDATENAMLAETLMAHPIPFAPETRAVAFIDGDGGGRRLVYDPTESMQSIYDRCPPETQREIRRRGWL